MNGIKSRKHCRELVAVLCQGRVGATSRCKKGNGFRKTKTEL